MKNRTRSKGASPLVKLGQSLAVPVNWQAARVLDAMRQKEREELHSRIRQLSKAIQKERDPAAKERLMEEFKKLKRSPSVQSSPGIGVGAMERARRQLERAKWERENRRS
jgi:hypothetical protein